MWFNEAKRRALLAFLGAVDYSALKVMLVTDAYTFNADHDAISDIVANEVTVTGYARQTPSGAAVAADLTGDFAYLDLDDTVFPGLAAGESIHGAILFVDTGSDATSWPVAFHDLANTPTNGSTITVQWAAAASGAVLKGA
jgi:hypothetical protein